MTTVLITTWAWLLMALVGFTYSIYLSRESWRDLRAVPEGARLARMVARANFMRDMTRMTIQALMAMAGFMSLASLPSSAGASTTSTLTRLLFRAIFIGIGALVMTSSVMDYRVRAATIDVIRKGDAE